MALTFATSLVSGVTELGHLDDLDGATQDMVGLMRRELWSFFAVPTTIGSTGVSSSLEIDRSPGAIARAWDDAMARMRPGLDAEAARVGVPPAQQDQWRGRQLEPWLTARRRLWELIAGDNSVEVTTWTGDSNPLIGFEYDSGSYSVNPFTWFVRASGNRSVSTLRASSARAAHAVGPTLMLLHELDHALGCITEGDPNQCLGTLANARNIHADPEFQTARDIDAVMRWQPDVAARGWYGGTQGRPGRHYYMGAGAAADAYGERVERGAAPAEGWSGDWVQWPADATLRRGSVPAAQPPVRPAPVPAAAGAAPPPPPVAAPAVTPGARRGRGRRRHVGRQPRSVIALQRSIGNRATVAALRAEPLRAPAVPAPRPPADAARAAPRRPPEASRAGGRARRAGGVRGA